MSVLDLYIIFALMPNLGTVFRVFAFIAVIGLAVSTISMWNCATWEPPNLRGKTTSWRCIKLALLCFMLFALMSALMPDGTQLAYITGGYAATNDAELRKLPDNILGAVNAYLGKIQDDAKEKK